MTQKRLNLRAIRVAFRLDAFVTEIGTVGFKVLGAAGSFFLTVLFARALGEAEFGVLSLSLAVFTIGGSLSRLGMEQVVIREVAKSERGAGQTVANGVLSAALLLGLAGSGLIATAIFFGAEVAADKIFQDPAVGYTLQWICIALIPTTVVFVASSYLQGLHRAVAGIALENVSPPFLTFFVALGLLPAFGLAGAVGAYIAGWALTAFAAIIILRRSSGIDYIFPRRDRLSDIKTDVRVILEFSPPLLLVNLAYLISMWGPSLILGALASSDEVAQFSVAARMTLLIGFVVVGVNAATAPRLAESINKNAVKTTATHLRKAFFLLGVSCGPLIGLYLVFPEILIVIFGTEYEPATIPLMILSIGQVSNAVAGPGMSALIMGGFGKTVAASQVVGTIFTLVLSSVLVLNHGAIGAAIGVATGQILRNGWGVLLVYKKLRVNLLRTYMIAA